MWRVRSTMGIHGRFYAESAMKALSLPRRAKKRLNVVSCAAPAAGVNDCLVDGGRCLVDGSTSPPQTRFDEPRDMEIVRAFVSSGGCFT